MATDNGFGFLSRALEMFSSRRLDRIKRDHDTLLERFGHILSEERKYTSGRIAPESRHKLRSLLMHLVSMDLKVLEDEEYLEARMSSPATARKAEEIKRAIAENKLLIDAAKRFMSNSLEIMEKLIDSEMDDIEELGSELEYEGPMGRSHRMQFLESEVNVDRAMVSAFGGQRNGKLVNKIKERETRLLVLRDRYNELEKEMERMKEFRSYQLGIKSKAESLLVTRTKCETGWRSLLSYSVSTKERKEQTLALLEELKSEYVSFLEEAEEMNRKLERHRKEFEKLEAWYENGLKAKPAQFEKLYKEIDRTYDSLPETVCKENDNTPSLIMQKMSVIEGSL